MLFVMIQMDLTREKCRVTFVNIITFLHHHHDQKTVLNVTTTPVPDMVKLLHGRHMADVTHQEHAKQELDWRLLMHGRLAMVKTVHEDMVSSEKSNYQMILMEAKIISQY